MIAETLGRDKALVGMVHVGASPGAPFASENVERHADRAAADAAALVRAGFDAIIVENMHDRPYLRGRVGPEVVACMTRACLAVRGAAPGVPVGVQILAGANCEALAVALACGASFIRAENFVFAAVADEGLTAEADAGRLLRYRRAIGADHIRVFADIKKKHSSHAITSDVSIAESAAAAEFFGADGVVVTGRTTGDPCDAGHVREAKSAAEIPVLVGSGATPENIGDLFRDADAVIVGSWIKREGRWENPVDADRAAHFVREAARRGRG